MQQTLEQLILDADFDYKNGLITSKHFPVPDLIQTSGAVLIQISQPMSTQEAINLLIQKQLRPGNVYELIEWKKNNYPTFKESMWVLALGQTWQCTSSAPKRVPFVSHESVNETLGICTISLGFFDSLLRGNEFLLAFKT